MSLHNSITTQHGRQAFLHFFVTTYEEVLICYRSRSSGSRICSCKCPALWGILVLTLISGADYQRSRFLFIIQEVQLMKHFTYTPKMVCSRQIDFDIDDDGKLRNVAFVSGCNGNLKAIGRLVEGADPKDIAELLRGNDCAGRGTSCADQLSKALEEAVASL